MNVFVGLIDIVSLFYFTFCFFLVFVSAAFFLTQNSGQ